MRVDRQRERYRDRDRDRERRKGGNTATDLWTVQQLLLPLLAERFLLGLLFWFLTLALLCALEVLQFDVFYARFYSMKST